MTRKSEGERHRRPGRLRHGRPGTGGPTRGSFGRLVEEALDEIPEPFLSKLQNVAVVVEDEPSPALLASLGMSRHDTLLGLYDGIPLTDRGEWYNLSPPDRIIIFRRPILALCSTPQEIREQVRRTVLHEVAHYYGIDDEELSRMGLD